MSFSNQGRFRQQVRFLQRQFLQDGELPFTDVLSEGTITQALKALDVVWLDRIYSPLVTLWVFLSQVLSQDHSCRAAVARLIAHRVSRGKSVLALRKRARTAKPESVYLRSSSLASLVSWEKHLTTKPIPPGCGKVDPFTCLMARRCRCPTRLRIKPLILRSTTRHLGWVSRLPESVRSCLCRVGRCLIWESAGMQVKAKAS